MAPYHRIVAEIRRRIVSGELRPGDRIPSVRRITTEWGVAIATATKALAVLQRDGLVHVVPGVGTIVSPATPERRPPRRAGEPPDLTRDRIVQAAMGIADAEGMAAVSMRRVAADVGAATMALYRYVRGKEDLILYMVDAAMGEEAFPPTAPNGWRADLELVARHQWALFRRHPWLAPAMSVTRPQAAPNALVHTERVLRALAPFGLDPGAVLHIHVTLFSFVRGLATNLEPEAEAERETGLTSDEWIETQHAALNAAAGSGAVASFLRTVRESDVDLSLDTLFEFGLPRLLDGLAVYLER